MGLGICALIVSQVESLYECDPTRRDCSCSDFSYKDCQEPVTEDQIHTANLEECIFQCDLFHSFGACDWFLYDQTDGMDENCHLFGPGREPMKDYLNSCNDRGRPTRDIDNTCYIDPLNDPVHFCDSADRCPGGCKTCAADDICDKIHETECTMETEGTDNSNSAPTAEGCNYFCTAEGLSGDVSYLVYSLREERCVCHYTGKRFCNNIVMEWPATIDDYFKCGHPSPDPTPGTTTPDPGCNTDDDCDDPPSYLCDNTDRNCKPGCHVHEDCNGNEYCECDEGTGCPGGSVGSCRLGCRDQGSSCTLADGSPGDCNSEHVCSPPGIPKIRKITATTRDCVGCDPNNEGATMTITVNNNLGADQTCTTPVLDNPGTTDYATGSSGVFTEDSLGPNAGGCKLYDAYVVNTLKVDWSGAGSWTPEMVTVDITMDICCQNAGMGSASAGNPLTLDCDQAFCT